MTPAEYKAERKKRGSQEKVAALLGVARSTVERRESDKMEITHEAALAIRSLRIPKQKHNT